MGSRLRESHQVFQLNVVVQFRSLVSESEDVFSCSIKVATRCFVSADGLNTMPKKFIKPQKMPDILMHCLCLLSPAMRRRLFFDYASSTHVCWPRNLRHAP